MKKYLFLVIALLIGVIAILTHQLNTTSDKWKTAEANVKAYSEELSENKNKNTALQLSVNQLKYFSDSVLVALNDTRTQLKIKDKNLKALQSVKSSFTKTDTITVTDTLFRNPTLNIDTTIQDKDKWYTMNLKLIYPSTIITTPYFKSDKHIIAFTKKETVNPPKKFFLLRWFQKKHKVLNIEVVEHNPYVTEQSSKYVEIIK